MSRAYRIKVKETARHVLRASDHVSTQLELLEVLPPERMRDLLANELQKRGFTKQGDKLIRREQDGVTVEIDPASATVTVKIQSKKEVSVKGLLEDLQRQAQEKQAELQKRVTDRLEGHLTDLRKELDQAVNRVTADALKEKAGQIGQIKEVSEDAQTGSLTIVLEV
jgi:chromosomal replication initiation ATPase DnaA